MTIWDFGLRTLDLGLCPLPFVLCPLSVLLCPLYLRLWTSGRVLEHPTGSIAVVPGEQYRLAAVNPHRLVRQFVEHEPVMRGEHHGSSVATDRLKQDFPRLDVQMVRRLVQNQKVGGRQERPDDGQPAPLAAGQHRHLLFNGVSGKEKRPEDTLHLIFGETGPGLGCSLQHGQIGVNRLLRALLVVRHLRLLAGPCLARIRGQPSRYDA